MIFTIFGIAVGATLTGLFGNFAYGIIGGGAVGGVIDLVRLVREKRPPKAAPGEEFRVPEQINQGMGNSEEVSNLPPRNFKSGEKDAE